MLSMVDGIGAIRLPQLFQSGMVIQRGQPVHIWGWGDSGEEAVAVWQGTEKKVVCDGSGSFSVYFPACPAGGPYELKIGEHHLTDVYVGDVWLCSGQSNMETTIERVYPVYSNEIDGDVEPEIRLFHVQYDIDTHGEKIDLRETSWKRLNKENAWKFSAIGYFLSKRMHEKTGVAQGVIASSWGGTPIEAWISSDSLRRHFPVYYRQLKLYQDDRFVSAQQEASQRIQRQWQSVLDSSDPGLDGGWTSESYDDSGWEKVNQYGSLTGGVGNFVGSLWLRQHIHIDKKDAGKPALLLLGTLFDCDYTYLNGKEVGRTYYQYPPRRYDVPAGLLHEGDNVLTIRFINKYGSPHFIHEKEYKFVMADGREQGLGEEWLAHTGVLMPSCPGGDISVNNQPSVLYNAMIRPLSGFPVAGVVWYQGESNTSRPSEYAPMLRLMRSNWRDAFGRKDLPFVIVQLANYMEPVEGIQDSGWSGVREAQRAVSEDEAFTELAVTIDIGETTDIHPLRKKDVAERVGLALDRMVYDEKVDLSPKVVSASVDGSKIVLTLDQDLRPCDGLKYFELAGDDHRFVAATAMCKGKEIVVKSSLTEPRYVRYAWKNNPLGVNLYGVKGLPVGPFFLDISRPSSF